MASPTTSDHANKAKGTSGTVSGNDKRSNGISNQTENERTIQADDSKNLAEFMIALFGPSNGMDLELPPREPMREPPTFD